MNDIQSHALNTGGELEKRRQNPRVDMTPMVDVAMLLLTFFMLTAVFNAPQIMELNLPESCGDISVGQKKILNLFVDGHSLLYKSHGLEKNLQPLEFFELSGELRSMNIKEPGMIALIRLDRQARYERLTEILDQLGLANVNRFRILHITEEEEAILGRFSAGNRAGN